jgi:Family of unknown function (DUF6152)
VSVRVQSVLVVLALAVMDVSLFGHHSTVAYAPQSIVLKKATMTKIVWANPHIILTFTVKETNGAVSTWSAESGSPGSVARVGWKRNSLKEGDVVTIELFPAKNGARVGRLKKVIFSDGHELLDTQNPETLKQ